MGSNRPSSHDSTSNEPSSQLSGASLFGRIGGVGIGSCARMISACEVPDYVDLNPLIPAIVRRPREGMQPDSYPFETPSFTHPNVTTDPVELMMERMGGIPQKK